MDLIGELHIRRTQGTGAPATIQLLHGDLAAIPSEHAVDVLVASAFPDTYEPAPGTLFESLFRRGLDMRDVAEHKEEDERARLGCWLSQRLPENLAERFRFERVLCFEPRYAKFVENSGLAEVSIQDSVAFVFRCLNNFIIPSSERRDFGITSIAMPLLATGNQRVPVEVLFPRLLESAVFWLEQGLPIEQLKIVAFKPADVVVARSIFAGMKAQFEDDRERLPAERESGVSDWESRLAQRVSRDVIQACQANLRERLVAAASDDERDVVERVLARIEPAAPSAASSPSTANVSDAFDFDVFISYAHKQEQEVKEFVNALRQHVPGHKIFFDRSSIPVGGQWIKLLSDAVQKARIFIALLSPDYTASPVCWDEFQCAKLKEYNTRQSIIKTVRLYSEQSLPPIMGIYSYVDCAEGDLNKLRDSVTTMVQ